MCGAWRFSSRLGRIHCFYSATGEGNVDTNLANDLDTAAIRLIRIKARQLIGRYGFRPDEVEDIQQILILDCLRRISRFDTCLGSSRKFICTLVNHAVANLIESQKSLRSGHGFRHYSLSAPRDDSNPNSHELANIISDDGDHCCAGRQPRSIEHDLNLHLDVERAVAALPAELRRICQLFMVL